MPWVDFGKQGNVALPMLESLLASNGSHIDRAYALVNEAGRRPTALLGLAFKPGTDDLRESPYVTLAERLVGRGYPLGIYDPQVDYSRLTGANREYVDAELPHLAKLLKTDSAAPAS